MTFLLYIHKMRNQRASPERGGARRAEGCAERSEALSQRDKINDRHPLHPKVHCRGGVPPPAEDSILHGGTAIIEDLQAAGDTYCGRRYCGIPRAAERLIKGQTQPRIIKVKARPASALTSRRKIIGKLHQISQICVKFS